MRIIRKHLTVTVAGVLVLVAAGGSVALASGSGSTDASSPSAPATASSLPANVVATWPMLRKAQTASEASQLPLVIAGLHTYGGPHNLDETSPTSEVNPELARRYYSNGANAGFLVPGSKGTVCTISVEGAAVAGGGCTTTESAEENGFVSWRLLAGESVELHGWLPSGSSPVTVATSAGTQEVTLNEDGGFDIVTTTDPTGMSYTLPDGHTVNRTAFLPNHSRGRFEE